MTDTMSVIGGGWSFEEVDQAKLPSFGVVAVNDSAVHLQRKPDITVSMDRIWTENRWDALSEMARPAWVRWSALKNIPLREHKSPWLHGFLCDIKKSLFSPVDLALNGDNSGVCALNLAFIMRPRVLYLYGFDMCVGPHGRGHWYPPYPWTDKRKAVRGATSPKRYEEWNFKFNHYAAQFKTVGMRVINVSSGSRVTSFERVTPRELGVGK